MSIIEAGNRRRAAADLCTALGLTTLASALGTVLVSRSPASAREALLKVRVAASDILACDPESNDALALEREAAAAIVLLDRVITERDELAARGCAPGLKMSARKMGGWR